MAHILATLHELEKDIVEAMLHSNQYHELDWFHLEHLWGNAEDDEEVIFLFETDNLDKAHIVLDQIHQWAMRHNPDIEPPVVIYLKK